MWFFLERQRLFREEESDFVWVDKEKFYDEGGVFGGIKEEEEKILKVQDKGFM